MSDHDILAADVLEDACLSVEALASVCSVSHEWIVHHVEEGLLSAAGAAPAEWRFTSRDVWRVRRMRLLESEFEAVPELAALFADLLDEMESLHARLRRAGLE